MTDELEEPKEPVASAKAAPAKAAPKGTDWNKEAAPAGLWYVRLGTKVQMKGHTALVSKVDERGRPTHLDYRDAEGVAHKRVPFLLGNYVRLA